MPNSNARALTPEERKRLARARARMAAAKRRRAFDGDELIDGEEDLVAGEDADDNTTTNSSPEAKEDQAECKESEARRAAARRRAKARRAKKRCSEDDDEFEPKPEPGETEDEKKEAARQFIRARIQNGLQPKAKSAAQLHAQIASLTRAHTAKELRFATVQIRRTASAVRQASRKAPNKQATRVTKRTSNVKGAQRNAGGSTMFL